MQKVSKAYKESMKQPVRNRGYIKAVIGVINSEAQKNVQVGGLRNHLTYYSNLKEPFNGGTVEKVYATAEQDFSKVDGSMYFLPKSGTKQALYNNGLVSTPLIGTIYISFGGLTGFDIKGLTIDFGEYYPTSFTIVYDEGEKIYSNSSQIFITEDVFNNVSYMTITANSMVNGNGRLRINQFTCGIANTFTNKEVRNYTFKDVVSAITDSIPSQDMSLEVDNQNLYYSVDNPDSTLAFFEIGQEMRVSFGYDIDGTGNIEWVGENTCYLKTWKADDVKAKFTATDRFDYLTDKYYKGRYREDGISLYDLAIDVAQDAGLEEDEYFFDPYLKKVIVYNPMPVVKHSEALQIIANAGRCTLIQDRNKRITMKSSFVPDMEVSVNNKTEYSKIDNLLKNTEKVGYAIASNDFSIVDGTVTFMPKNANYLETGYVSNSIYRRTNPEGTVVNRLSFRLGNERSIENRVVDDSCYWDGDVPKITITLEASFVAYGLLIRFRNVAPWQFVITTYKEDAKVQEITVDNPELEYVTFEEFEQFDKMVLTFTKGYPNARITIDNILVGDITDYRLTRAMDIQSSPTGTRQRKIKEIDIVRTVYKESAEKTKDIISDDIILNVGTTDYVVYMNNPSYELIASVVDNEYVTVNIIEQSNYFVKLRFEGVANDNTVVSYKVTGKEYVKQEFTFAVPHNEYGEVKSWKNPLISTVEQAKDLEEWLASYYLGDVEYDIKWRGDPRVDANDLMYLELKDRSTALVRAYNNSLKFAGAWSATTKARKVVMEWQ